MANKESKKIRKHESCVNYGKQVPMYKFVDKVQDNGAVVQEVVQMTPEEILEKATACHSYGDAMEAKPSAHNDYNDTFSQYDNLHQSIDNIQYQKPTENNE